MPASLAAVTDTTHEQALPALRGGPSRYALAAGLLAVVVVGLAIALIVGLGSHHAGAVAHASAGERAGAQAAQAKAGTLPGAAHGGGAAAGVRSNVAEVADPTESSSFPAPATARHKAAAAPAKAGEEVVATGAPSDAEVRKELAQMQAVERAAKQTQQRSLTPVTGGESIGGNGTLPIPTNVPEVIQKVVAGANAIADFPYVFGGGHASFVDNAYDCSGSVSYALAAGGLLGAPETSGELESWGAAGPGRYITVYANAGHTYMYVNGILYDTAGRSGVYASRWLVSPVDNAGYVARHWPGL
jgi:cell wall-associated NlpC family hydrolase